MWVVLASWGPWDLCCIPPVVEDALLVMKVLFRFPGVMFTGIAFPVDKIFAFSWWASMVNNMGDFKGIREVHIINSVNSFKKIR